MIASILRNGLLIVTAAASGLALDLPPGFTANVVCEGFTGATGMAVAPDGRVFVCEQTGALRVVVNGKLVEKPVLELPVDSFWERGLLGIALDPGFPAEPFAYVLWTAAKPWPHHRLSRFSIRENAADPSSEVTLFEGDNQDEMPGSTKAGHQGGGIAFAPDGTLFVAIGEQTANTPSQDLRSLLGKILRLNRDGSIPKDNPFVAKTSGRNQAIWARGLRNPWVLAFQPGTGRLFINDIGGSGFEEINDGLAGENYGWPLCEGEQELPGYRDPVFDYGHAVGQSLGGGCFYPAPEHRKSGGSAWFPPEFSGKYIFQDYMAGWMSLLDPASPRKSVKIIARKLAKPTAVAVAPDGALLVLERNQWVKDEKFQERTGRLIRITPGAGPPAPAKAPGPFAPQLSNTNLFARLAPLTAAKGGVECDVRVAQWEPGARVRRWLHLPAQKKASVDQSGEFVLPPDTRVVRHLDSAGTGRPLLTSVITILAGNQHRAATYRWREDRADADLIESSALIDLDGRKWIVGGSDL